MWINGSCYYTYSSKFNKNCFNSYLNLVFAMSINIFLTGNPGIGKTTIIQKFIRSYPLSMGGFYTHEIREHGIRVGFTIEAIRSWEKENQDDFEKKYQAIMAHVNCKSPYRTWCTCHCSKQPTQRVIFSRSHF